MSVTSLADAIVRLAARLVPRWRRTDWEREWSAELRYGASTMPPRATLTRSIGALLDAAWLRIESAQFDLWWGDLTFACRVATRRPGLTLLAATMITLAIGVACAVFAIVDAVLVRPLGYHDPSRLVFVWQTLPAHNVFELEATPFDYAQWRGARSFADLALVSSESFTLTGSAEPERVRGARVTSSLFQTLGIAPRIGRAFTPAEDSSASAPVAILSDGLWRRRFAADLGVLGATIDVDGIPTAIVGVMPPDAFLPGPLAGDDELWLPARMTAAERDDEIGHSYSIVGRLADHVSLSQAEAEIRAISASVAAAHSSTHAGIGVRLVTIPEQTVREIRPALALLMVGVGLLVIIAGANVVTLLLARASTRQQERAVRAALGAGWSRLASLAVAESVVITALGGVAGVTLADWILAAFLPAFADALPRAAHIAVDARVAVSTFAASLLLGIVFGLIVALQKPAAELADSLRAGSRLSPSAAVMRTRTVLVVSQIALAVVLLTGSGVLVRSFVRLSHVRPGFDPAQVLTFRIALPEAAYSTPASNIAFVDAVTARLSAIPGVAAAGANTHIPFGRSRGANGVAIEGRPRAPGEILIADQREVTPGYFRAIGMTTVAGRVFTAGDDARHEQVAVVNETMARLFWPGTSPIDKRVRVTSGDEASGWMRIVGVVNDVRHVDLSRAPVAEMYRPYAQMPLRNFVVVLRTTVEPTAITPNARTAVAAIDPHLPLYDIRTMAARIAESVAKTRALAVLLLATAVLAAVMAGTAIYGTIWYAVSQRIPEIGIRLALGATRRSVCATIIGRALAMTAAGAAVGVVASVAFAPMLRGMTFETNTVDVATYGAVVAFVALLTLIASLVPARRAMDVDPLIALRAD